MSNLAVAAGNAGTINIGDYEVNRLGFGAMRLTGEGIWGEPQNPAEARQVLSEAVKLGVNFIDTADAYGPEVSERIVAEVLQPYDGLLVATKGGLVRNGPGSWHPECTPEHLRKSCEASLNRLGVEKIDLYQLHTVDPHVPFRDSLQTLINLKKEGKIRHIGLSNVEPEHLEQALAMTEIVSVQNNYNVRNREHEDVLRICEEQDVAFIAYFPLDAGKLAEEGDLLKQIADKYAATPSQIALAWLLAHSDKIVPIPGTSSLEHVRNNLASASLRLDGADLQMLDELQGE